MNVAPASQSEAQRRADRIRVLRAELDELARQGVLELTPDQRGRFDAWSSAELSALETSFDVDTTDSAKRVSWGLRIASTLGGIALCAALVMFFTRYWGYFDTWMQVSVITAAPFAALACTEYAARRERTLYFATLFALLTIAAFVNDLAMLGRIFNLTSSENALLVWGALAGVLAYRYGLRLLLLIGIGFLGCYVSAAFTDVFGVHWMHFADRPEHFGALGLAVFVVPSVVRHERHTDFPAVYRFAGALAFFAAAFILSEWGASSYLPFERKTVEFAYECLGLVSTAAAIWLGIARGWTGVVNTASAFFVLFLYFRLYHWLWDLMPKFAFFAVIGAIAIVLVIAFKRVRGRIKREAAA